MSLPCDIVWILVDDVSPTNPILNQSHLKVNGIMDRFDFNQQSTSKRELLHYTLKDG